jgi:hypothetical protein
MNMNPRVVGVVANPDFTLSLTFSDGARRRFDVKPFLGRGVFQELAKFDYFRQVCVTLGSVAWPNEQDFCPDTMYADSREELAHAEQGGIGAEH